MEDGEIPVFFVFFKKHRELVVVQLLSHVWLFSTPGTAAYQAPLSTKPVVLN